MSFLFPLFAFSQLCASDNIFPWFWKRETTKLEHIDRNVIWSVRRQKYLHRLLRSVGKRQPPLYTLRGRCHPRRSMCKMVSYLIVRLVMQYFHIVSHTAVTSPEASDMPKKNAHGTGEEVKTKFFFKKKKEKHNCSNSPLKEPQRVQSVLTPSSTTNYTPHPSLSIENPQRNSFFFRC